MTQKVKREMVEQIKKAIEEADLVLVGIGEEFGSSEKQIMAKYQEVFADENLGEQALGYLVGCCRELEKAQSGVAAQSKAYENLLGLIRDKNYFCVSVNTDDVLYHKIGQGGETFRQDRIVTPCGGYRKLQCPSGCADVWQEPDEEWNLWAKGYVQAVQQSGTTGEEYRNRQTPQEKRCPKCGGAMVFNNVYAQHYEEQGYLDQWKIYTKWLEGTVNKKVCILELGAGMKFPTVIRWPFEKVAAYNQKAVMFRVHNLLYQFPDNMAGRGISVPENPVDFFANKFV